MTLSPGAPAAAAISTTGLPAGSVRLTWSAAPTSAPPVTGYVVGRTGSSTVTPTPYSETVSPGQRSWVFSKLVPGQEYRLWVAAVDGSGTGPVSTVVHRYLPVGFRPAPPTAPVLPAVRWIDGTSAEISWLTQDLDGGSAVTGYEVGRDGTAYGNPGGYTTTVSAATTAFTFRQLIPGRAYTFTVRAITAAGRGATTTAPYTVPGYGAPQPDAAVYALREGSPRVLERISGPGPVGPVAGATGDVSFAVDRQGSLYVADRTAATVRRYPAGGGAPVAVGSGWGAPTDLNLDARGNVFVLDTALNRAVEIRAVDGRRIVFPQDASDADLTVGRDGSVSLTGQVQEDGLSRVAITTVQAQGERPATAREIGTGQFSQSFAGPDGAVLVLSNSGTGAGADGLQRVDVGATEGEDLLGSSWIAAGNDRRGQVVASRIRYWCPAAQEGCNPDSAVEALTVFGAGSARATVPVSGIDDPFSLAADSSGRFYALQQSGIVRTAATGGAAAAVATGQFARFAVGWSGVSKSLRNCLPSAVLTRHVIRRVPGDPPSS